MGSHGDRSAVRLCRPDDGGPASTGTGCSYSRQSRRDTIQEDRPGGDPHRGAQARPVVYQGDYPREVGLEGQHLDGSQGNERCADCSHAPAAYLQGDSRCQPACRDPAPEI